MVPAVATAEVVVVLAVLAAVYASAALGLCLMAIAWALHLAGQSWPAALLLTAGGCVLLALCLGFAARAALGRAMQD